MITRPNLKLSLLSRMMSKKVPAAVMMAGLIGCEGLLANESDLVASTATFDADTLRSRGIDPKLAEFFSTSARFLPGTKEVALFVNEDRIGSVMARFDDEGQLCFDKRLLDKAGLLIPEQVALSNPQPASEGDVDMASHTASSVATSNETDSEAEPTEAAPGKSLLQHTVGPISAWSARPALAQLKDDGVSGQGGCYDFKTAYPQTEVDLRPGKQEVHLIVPQEALVPIEKDFSDYHTGGVGGLFNYDVLTMKSQSTDMESSYSSLGTEAGMNIGDWALRSRQNWIDQDGERTTEHLYAYAQRTFLPLSSIVQVGQVTIASPVFAGASITGLQILPDTALSPDSAGGATIEGIAQTSQARVEVKQDGLLLYTAVVPIGPFTFRNVPLMRMNSNVDVTIFEADGQEHSFSLPAASLHVANLSKTGISMAGGKVRDVGDSGSEEPEVFTVSNDWLVGSKSKVAAGVMLSGDYTAAGSVIDTVFSRDTSLSVSTVVSQAAEDGNDTQNGLQNSITARTKLTERLTASGSVTHQTDGYRDLLDTTDVDEKYPIYEDPTNPDYLYDWDDEEEDEGYGRTQYSANLGFSTESFGGGSLGFIQSKASDGDWSRTLSASWGKTYKGVSLSATVQHDMTGDNGNAAFLSVSIPLGENRSLQSRVSKSGDSKTQIGATYNERVNESLNYSLSATQQDDEDGTSLAGNVSATPRYAQVNLGYSQDGADSSNYSAGVRGALAFHPDGVTPSPYHIQDTFGIAKVGDEAGVKISTPNGSVWTDAGGRAVVSQIPAYSSSRLEVATDTLPRNVDIDNGYKTLEVGRGSVSLIEFGVVKVRRLLLTAVDQSGNPLPKGASVISKDDAFVTTVVDDGKIFLEDTSQTDLTVNLPGGKQCALNFKLAEEADVESYFEQASAVCPIS